MFSLDNKSAGRQSVASNLTKPDAEDDGDSLAEYGEGETGKYNFFWKNIKFVFNLTCFMFFVLIFTLLFAFFFLKKNVWVLFDFYCFILFFGQVGMNEDGSFIGQYGQKKNQDAQAFATLV